MSQYKEKEREDFQKRLGQVANSIIKIAKEQEISKTEKEKK